MSDPSKPDSEVSTSEVETQAEEVNALKNEAEKLLADTESFCADAATKLAEIKGIKDHVNLVKAAIEAVHAKVEETAIETEEFKDQSEASKTAAESSHERAEKAATEVEEFKKLAATSKTDAATSANVVKIFQEKVEAAQAAVESLHEKVAEAATETEEFKQQAETSKSEAAADASHMRILRDQVESIRIETEQLRDRVQLDLLKINELVLDATREAEQAAKAHNLSTTAGLAGSFNQKAIAAKERETFWGWMLAISLVAAGTIGYMRYEKLSLFLDSKHEPYELMANLFLAVLGVSAPLWLAWMSTRMISKNFAITEDYAYKASLAQAYVGFKKEALGLDALFEQRLFAAAVTQLDANPVRFVHDSHPGSPLQDLLQQPFMQDMMKTDSIRAQLLEWLKSRFQIKTLPFAMQNNPVDGGKTPNLKDSL